MGRAAIRTDPLAQASPGLKEHCHRVALWSKVLAEELSLQQEDRDVVEEVGLLHHTPSEVLCEATVDRLLADVGVSYAVHPGKDCGSLSSKAKAVLRTLRFGERSVTAGESSKLAEIVETADYLDQQFETGPLERLRLQCIMDEARSAAAEGLLSAGTVEAFSSLRKSSPEDVLKLIPKLPVYPAVAIKALSMLSRESIGLIEIEQLCQGDQVITGLLLKTANSSVYNRREGIRTVRDAISYIGLDATRKVLMAATLRPLFATSQFRLQWRHSLEAAQIAEQIAAVSGAMPGREAFIAGLMHDIGRLALSLLPTSANTTFQRLVKLGCEPLIAELVVFGFDHAEAGAEVLTRWKLPLPMLEGVRYHHEPERTDAPAAAVIYLCEYWTASEEDLPSQVRVRAALNRLSMTETDLRRAADTAGRRMPALE